MIKSFQRLLIVTLLVSSVRSEILKAKDAQMCTNLCSSCGGSATFVNEICTCLILENDEQAAQCMNHLKQQTEDPTMGAKVAEDIANRAARCSGLLGSTHKIGPADIDRVASYFMNGGPLTGTSLLGSSNSGCVSSPNNETTGASNPDPQTETPVSKTPSLNGDAAKTSLLGAEAPKTPLLGAEAPKTPLLGAEAPKTPLLGVQAPKSPLVGASCEKSPLVSSPRLPNLGLHHALGAPRPLGILQPHGLTGAIPDIMLGIPHAILSAVPRFLTALHPQLLGAMHYPGLLGASQHTQLNPLLGALATGTHGIIQNVDNLVSAYVPGSNREQQVGSPHDQLADAIMGIPNGLLGAARIPAYVPGVLQATHYSPLLGAVASGTHGVLQNLDNLVSSLTPGSDRAKMVGAPQVQNKAGVSAPSVGSQAAQQPSPLHQVLAHHNNLLEALSQHLRSIGPQVGLPISPYPSQSRNGIVGAANSMSSCPSQERASPTLENSNPIAAETSGQSEDESVNKKVSEDTAVGSAANSNNSNDLTANQQDAVEANETIIGNAKEETAEETAKQAESTNEVITGNAKEETTEEKGEETIKQAESTNEAITGNAKEETAEETAVQAESTNEVMTGNAKEEVTKQAKEPATGGKISVDGALHKQKRNVYFSTGWKRQNDKYIKKTKTPPLPLRAF